MIEKTSTEIIGDIIDRIVPCKEENEIIFIKVLKEEIFVFHPKVFFNDSIELNEYSTNVMLPKMQDAINRYPFMLESKYGDLLKMVGFAFAYACLKNAPISYAAEDMIKGLGFINQDISELPSYKKTIEYLEYINKKKPQKEKPVIEIKLIWLTEDGILKDISNRVFQSGYTSKQLNFYNVFKKGKKTKWLKEPEYLLYLLYKLYSDKPPLYKAGFGKAHLSTAINLFDEFSQKLANKNSPHYLLNRITTRKPENYVTTTKKVDTMLSQVLTNSTK